MGHGIAERGREFGTVTGRPRRVGWFDTVPLRYAVAVNSNSAIVLNKLDILSGIETIKLCVAYEIDGRRVETWPSSGSAARPGEADLRGLRGLGGADPRRPLARQPARGGTPLRDRARGARRRADRARVRRPGADPDHRACVASHAPPPREAGLTGAVVPVSLIMPTRVLVLGGGGREHALAWKLAGEPGVNEVFVAPGSAAIATEARVRVVAVDPLDPAAVVARSRARRQRSSSSSGPRRRSSVGVADALAAAGFAVFGPTRAAAGSRRRRRSATRSPRRPASGWPGRAPSPGRGAGRASPGSASSAPRAAAWCSRPDGLAAGKGVIVTDSAEQAVALAPSSSPVAAGAAPALVVEERLEGREASVIAICDGTRCRRPPGRARPQAAVRRRRGPNTGGMGAYSPLPDLPDATRRATSSRPSIGRSSPSSPGAGRRSGASCTPG